LCKRDIFNLALTSKKTYDRLKALKLLSWSAADRFFSAHQGRKPKELSLLPLIAEMLSNPMPKELLTRVKEEKGTCSIVFHSFTPPEIVLVFCSVFEMRGYKVVKRIFKVNGFPNLSKDPTWTGPFNVLAKDTPKGLLSRFAGLDTLSAHQRPGPNSLKIGRATLANQGAGLLSFHFEFIEEILSESDHLVVDLCFFSSAVVQTWKLLHGDSDVNRRYMNCATQKSKHRAIFVPAYPAFRALMRFPSTEKVCSFSFYFCPVSPKNQDSYIRGSDDRSSSPIERSSNLSISHATKTTLLVLPCGFDENGTSINQILDGFVRFVFFQSS
jgi:hypothetical protein